MSFTLNSKIVVENRQCKLYKYVYDFQVARYTTLTPTDLKL